MIKYYIIFRDDGYNILWAFLLLEKTINILITFYGMELVNINTNRLKS